MRRQSNRGLPVAVICFPIARIDWRNDIMVTKLFMELKNLFADLASTLILGKNKDAANLALILSEKSKALAEELGK